MNTLFFLFECTSSQWKKAPGRLSTSQGFTGREEHQVQSQMLASPRIPRGCPLQAWHPICMGRSPGSRECVVELSLCWWESQGTPRWKAMKVMCSSLLILTAEAVEVPDANHVPLRTAGVWQGQDCQGSMYLDILGCDFPAILQNCPCHCLAQAVLEDVVVLVYLACCHTPEPFFTPLCLTPSPQSWPLHTPAPAPLLAGF